MGERTGSRVSRQRPEVSAVRGGTVGAAPDREREGETREGNQAAGLYSRLYVCWEMCRHL